MMKIKTKLDEMQEQTLLKIEHRGFCITFWGLSASIYFQTAIGNNKFEHIGGEAIILIIVAIYTLIDCIRNGIWDRKLQPNFKTNLLISVVAGGLVGAFWFALSFYRYHMFFTSLITFVMMFIFISISSFALLTLTATIYKIKKRKLDEMSEEDD